MKATDKEIARFKALPVCFLTSQDRVAPSEILRSALFGIGSRKKREQLTNHPIFICGETKITYTGQELDQRDLDVFMAAIRMAYDNEKELEMKCSLYAMQKMLDLKIGGSNREHIKLSFERLTSGTINIKNDRYHYCGHLIESFLLDKATNSYILKINSRLGQLFQSGYTRINWRQRCKIRSNLGKRLHSLVLSHAAPAKRPQRYTTENIKKLCRSKDSDERRFKAKIRQHMRTFKETGEVKTWTLQKNTLYYTRT